MRANVAGRRRRPTQERAKATREHILDTAARLFGERGIANTSTNRIATEAGVSVGTLYRYFADRAVIVDELLERMLQNTERRLTEQIFDVADRTVHALFADILRVISDELVANARLVRAMVAGVQFYSSGLPEFEPRLHLLIKVVLIQILGPGDDHRYDLMTFVILNTSFAAVLRVSAVEVDVEDRDRAIDMTARMVAAWLDAEAAAETD
ncbi:TetR/AcrR family transcriptional regulator [Nocardia bovistercoris]|uniref:TetR/AcrR family transcriptional regulator n=1 Tax=Nocardia bovistercoris TaxID=2785916 RepID=A0A931N015_9NOCA|nr:TetR family transcriptional regulator [Nocardia bovistercoris]MBH0776750.1 TetR/AcrR family transcriptional regulator [Nocardia bovistercoris]